MKVAIITPYCKESDTTLARCIDSVLSQTVPCHHYLMADGPGYQWLHDGTLRRHVTLGEPHRDYGGTPRGIGALLAIQEGAEAICFLDADNAFDPDHVATCLSFAADNDYVAARRRIVLPDGTPVNCLDEPIERHVDTNCFFFLPGSFHTLPRWAVQPRQVTILGDRLFLASLNGLKYAATDKPTVTYVSGWKCHYEAAGVKPPADAKPNADWRPVAEWWTRLSPSEKTVVRRKLALPHFDLQLR